VQAPDVLVDGLRPDACESLSDGASIISCGLFIMSDDLMPGDIVMSFYDRRAVDLYDPNKLSEKGRWFITIARLVPGDFCMYVGPDDRSTSNAIVITRDGRPATMSSRSLGRVP